MPLTVKNFSVGWMAVPMLGIPVVVLGQAQTLRIAEYNIDDSDEGNNNNITGSDAGVPTVMQAMGIHSLVGDSQPLDVLALTELLDTNNNSITSTTLPALVNALNNI